MTTTCTPDDRAAGVLRVRARTTSCCEEFRRGPAGVGVRSRSHCSGELASGGLCNDHAWTDATGDYALLLATVADVDAPPRNSASR